MSIATQTKNRSKKPLEPQVPDFCPACDAVDHPFAPVRRKVEQEFRGETLEVEAPAMRCQHCGFEIAVPGSLDALRLATADAYRQRHGLLTSEQIVSRRSAMGMTQRVFADHVGVGVASLQRWENGLVVQDKGSDLLIRERTKHTLFTPAKVKGTVCWPEGVVTIVRVFASHSAVDKHEIEEFIMQGSFKRPSSASCRGQIANVATFSTRSASRYSESQPATAHRWDFDKLCGSAVSDG
jgi:putative zinc finger/helix-turn-helix YgiT family protein